MYLINSIFFNKYRSVIENYFGLLKECWPIFNRNFRMNIDKIGIIFRMVVILTNMKIEEMGGLRWMVNNGYIIE